LVYENLWLILSASLTGSIFLIASSDVAWQIGAIILLVLVWWAILFLMHNRKWRPALSGVLLQLAIWITLGLSYGVLLPLSTAPQSILLTLGAFAISWLVGFLTLFAPGGIGTREAAIVTLMLPLLPAESSLILASLHRLLWVLVEVLFGLTASFLRRQIENAVVT
jgi:uncharacterized membrane protein YbhN (UPF0104 family)